MLGKAHLESRKGTGWLNGLKTLVEFRLLDPLEGLAPVQVLLEFQHDVVE